MTQFIEHLAEVRTVLAEAARALGGRHEERGLVRVEVLGVDDLEEIAKRDLLRVALLAA